MSHLVDKAPEVLTIKTVNPTIGLPRRHVNTLLRCVATRFFSRTCEGGLVADEIFTKDLTLMTRLSKYQIMVSLANTYHLLTLQLALRVTSLTLQIYC